MPTVLVIMQIEDRRSSVNKQACHTLTALALALGTRFQDHAAYFLPSLFKVLPITVLVGATQGFPQWGWAREWRAYSSWAFHFISCVCVLQSSVSR